jgi:hypothetical protein
MEIRKKLSADETAILEFVRDVPIAEVDIGNAISTTIKLKRGVRGGRVCRVNRNLFNNLRPFFYGNGIKPRTLRGNKVLVSLNKRGLAALAA